jgi:hypothetical protein
MKDKEKGAHEWIIEFKKTPENTETFQKILDETLQSLNSDYEAKRYNNMTLNPLVLQVARPGLFYDWLKSRINSAASTKSRGFPTSGTILNNSKACN